MTFTDQALTALANLRRRKLRTALTSLGVVVGTLTLVVMVSLALGVRQQINRQFASIGLDRMSVRPAGTGGRGGFFNFGGNTPRKIISPAEVTRWSQLPGVAKATAEVNLSASVQVEIKLREKVQTVRAVGGEPMRPMQFNLPTEPLAGSLELPEQGGIVLSQGALEALGVASNSVSSFLGQEVEAVLRTSRGETQSFKLKLHGVSPERASTMQISAADTLRMKSWWFNTPETLQTQGYDVVTIRAKDVGAVRQLQTQIRREGYQVQSIEALLEAANRVFLAITVMFAMICSIALLVASIGIANTMVMAIYERTREIGTLKALGASRAEIRQMFMIEAGCIGAMGGIAGLLIGWLLGVVLNHGIAWYLQRQEMPLRGDFFVVTLALALGVLIFATGIGVVAGLLPAQRAAALDPLTALRHE